MKQFIISVIASLLILSSFALMVPAGAIAQSPQQTACEGAGGVWSNGQCGDGEAGIGRLIQSVVNLLLFAVGAVAVIMLIIGGFRFVVSAGDSNAVQSARNTIIYAIIGIIVAFLAYAAVNFVLGRLN